MKRLLYAVKLFRDYTKKELFRNETAHNAFCLILLAKSARRLFRANG